MHRVEEFDLVVVGGGPGGSTVATFVAKQGYRVLLLEREKLPFYKVGESLLPATVHGICPLLGVSKALKRANFVTKLGGTFFWGKVTEPWTFRFDASSKIPKATSTAYQVERMKFDQILLDNARQNGVDVREQHTATGLVIEVDRVVGVRFVDDAGAPRTALARYVADASGHQTMLARHLGERVYSQFFQNIALFGYYRNGRRLPAPNQGNIFSAAFKYGWFWYIPLSPTLTSVGAVIGKEYASMLTRGHEFAMKQFISDCPRIQELLTDAERITDGPYGELRVRKDYSYCHTRFWCPGLVLIGDSACFIDPVFSSGVHLATYSGLLAARSINSCLRQGVSEQRSFSEFESRYRREFANFYDFLLSFYDVDQELDSYFWHARKIVNSGEAGNQAFVNLVAGVAGTGERMYSPEDFIRNREGLGDVLFPQCGNDTAAVKQTAARRSEFYKHLVGEITQLQLQASFTNELSPAAPLFPGGLITSADGLHWIEPRVSGSAE